MSTVIISSPSTMSNFAGADNGYVSIIHWSQCHFYCASTKSTKKNLEEAAIAQSKNVRALQDLRDIINA